MVLAYPLIRLSGKSEVFNLPLICALLAILAAGFVYSLGLRASADVAASRG
jgi:hypothetical protein